MIEIEVLYLMNDLLDRCELVLDIQTSTNRSEIVMKSHCNSMHDVSFDARSSSSELIIEHSFSKLSQKEKVSSNLNSLIVEQVAEAAQSSDIPVNLAEMIQDESKESESISYSPCEGPLFSDSESECLEIITEEIINNNKSENLKLLAHTQPLDSDGFPSLSNKLMIHKNVSQISNDKEVSSESDTSVHEEAEISDVQEIKGKKLEIYKNDWIGYNHSLQEDAMKIILPDIQNTIKLCTGNSTNKNIDLLGQVKNEYSVKALVEETDCCDITSEIQSGSQHGEHGEINLQSELSNINGMDSNEFVENAELNIDNPDNTDHYTIDSSNFDEVVSKTFSVKTIIDGYLDDVPFEESSEQIVSNTLKSNYISLFDTSNTNTEEISENVTANDKQEIEAMNDVKILFSSLLESTNSTDLKRTEENFEDNKQPLIKYEIDTSAGNIEQLLIDSQNADTDRGCKKEEINTETKAFDNDRKTKAVSNIEEENKNFFEPNEPCEHFNNRNGTKHIKPFDCQEIKFVDRNLKPNLNKVQTTLNNTSFMKETEVNETFRRRKLSSERSNCEKNKCAWNNADSKINDTLADKESCAKVNRCSDIHRSKSEMKLDSIEMFHKNVDIFHDNDSSILENSLFDGQNTCTGKEQLSTLMNDSNLHDILLKSPLKAVCNNRPNVKNDLKFMNTNTCRDINSQNSKEYNISCVKVAFRDMSQSAVSCSLKELTSGGQDQENKSKGIFNDLCKSPLHHFSQLAEEDTSRETTVVKSDVYRSEVETPDAYIDLDGDLEDVLMYPATQCFKPSIAIGDRAEIIEAFPSDNMNEFEMDDVKVPDVNHKRTISQVYSRNQDTSEIKKSRKENSLLISNPYFKWNQTVPVSAGINGEEVISMKSLTCSRPLRLGLSKKQKTRTLHKN